MAKMTTVKASLPEPPIRTHDDFNRPFNGPPFDIDYDKFEHLKKYGGLVLFLRRFYDVVDTLREAEDRIADARQIKHDVVLGRDLTIDAGYVDAHTRYEIVPRPADGRLHLYQVRPVARSWNIAWLAHRAHLGQVKTQTGQQLDEEGEYFVEVDEENLVE